MDIEFSITTFFNLLLFISFSKNLKDEMIKKEIMENILNFIENTARTRS